MAVIALTVCGYSAIASLPLFLNVESRTVSVPFRAFILGYSLVVAVTFAREGALTFRRYGAAYLLFWILYAARIAYDTAIRPDELSRPSYEYYLTAFGGTLLPSIACFALLTRKQVRVAGLCAWTLALLGAALLGRAYLLGATTASEDTQRFALETLNPISVGHLGATLLLTSFYAYARTGRLVRLLAVAGAAGGLFILSAAASRGPIVALACAGLAAVVSYFRRGLRDRSAKAILLAVAIATAFVVAAVPTLTYVESVSGFSAFSRLAQVGSSYDDSSEIRKSALRGAWQQFLDSPVLGDALEERSTRFYPHNILVEAFMATGIVGGLLLLGVFVGALRNAYRLISSRTEFSWIGFLCIQYAAGSMFSGSIWASDSLFCLMAASSAAARALATEHQVDSVS